MSLTSYRAAPPRVTMLGCWAALSDLCALDRGLIRWRGGFAFPAWAWRLWAFLGRKRRQKGRPLWGGPLTVNGFFTRYAPALMPGDDLLFQRLSVSTIGAVRFHGRVRDGIGWGTDAMVTKQ
jgi:hypothetical protein